MPGDDDRERAWGQLHDAVAALPGWAVGPATWHGETETWHVVVVDLRPRGRQARREAIEATRTTEIAALEALAALLRDRASRG